MAKAEPSFSPGQVLVSVEHASSRVPAALGTLGLPASWLRSHHAWDPGAATVGRILSRGLGAGLWLGRWSRLVADLNRSAHHPRVVPRRAGGRAIPANEGLTAAQRVARLDRFWRPWRERVEAELDGRVRRYGLVLHLSVHSFVPSLNGEVRNNDVGLLYDPGRRRELRLAGRLHPRIEALGFAVRRNFPYTGKADGFCSRMRVERPAGTYVGLELETNQRVVGTAEDARRLGYALLKSLQPEIDT